MALTENGTIIGEEDFHRLIVGPMQNEGRLTQVSALRALEQYHQDMEEIGQLDALPSMDETLKRYISYLPIDTVRAIRSVDTASSDQEKRTTLADQLYNMGVIQTEEMGEGFSKYVISC